MWDAEYRSGRYAGDGPVPMVRRAIATLSERGLSGARGVYLGCGNGRNYVPLREAGLALDGVDVSPVAIAALLARAPRPREGASLTCGDLMGLEPDSPYAYVVAIQSLMHGTLAEAARRFAKVDSLLAPGGLLFLRINTAASEVTRAHEALEETPLGGRTVRYLGGERDGLVIHFFTEAEIRSLLPGYSRVGPTTTHVVPRTPPEAGQWTQLEAVLQKPA